MIIEFAENSSKIEQRKYTRNNLKICWYPSTNGWCSFAPTSLYWRHLSPPLSIHYE